MEEEEVDEEVVTVDVKVDLPSDEREAVSELAESVDDPIDECLLETPLLHVTIDCEEVQNVGVFGDLLREIRVRAIKDTVEIRWCRFETCMRIRSDVMAQNIAGPPMSERLIGVPITERLVAETVEQDHDVTPWQSRSR